MCLIKLSNLIIAGEICLDTFSGTECKVPNAEMSVVVTGLLVNVGKLTDLVQQAIDQALQVRPFFSLSVACSYCIVSNFYFYVGSHKRKYQYWLYYHQKKKTSIHTCFFEHHLPTQLCGLF